MRWVCIAVGCLTSAAAVSVGSPALSAPPQSRVQLRVGLAPRKVSEASPTRSNRITLGGVRRFQRSAPRIRALDALSQLLILENQANDAGEKYRRADAKVDVPGTTRALEEVRVDLAPKAPRELKGFLHVAEGRIRWPFHPYNTAAVAFHDSDRQPEASFPGELTASRSIAFRIPSAFSIKLATNFPHQSREEPSKAHMAEETAHAIPLSDHITQVERELGPTPGLVVLAEVASVYDPKTREGYTIRDLRPLQDARYYYFPATSIESFGDNLMHAGRLEVTDSSRNQFWKAAYAEATGRARAQLLLRYGLIESTPNPQNWLIELDRHSMLPTGRLILRDVVDTEFVGPLAERLGYADTARNMEALGRTTRSNWYKFNKGTKTTFLGLSDALQTGFAEAHTRAFLSAIRTELSLNFESLDQVKLDAMNLEELDAVRLELETYLHKVSSPKLLRNYRSHLTAQARR